MDHERSTLQDLGFLALAIIPSLLVFLVPAFVEKPARMPVVYLGVGLSVVLMAIGSIVLRGTRGRQRRWLMGSTMVAAAPFVVIASSIGLQWLVHFAGLLFRG